MKDEVTKKIFNDLFAAPATLIPVVGGLTLLIGSWVIGSTLLAAAGLMGTVVGIGIFATKLIFGLDKITKDAYQHVLTQQENSRNAVLDQLDLDLSQDKDPRPEECLRALRVLSQRIREQAEVNPLKYQLIETFDKLFAACVEKIKQTDVLWRQSLGLKGVAKKELVAKREQIVCEIEETTQQLTVNVEQFQTIRSDRDNSELQELRAELDQTLTVARRTEERLSGLHNKSYDPKEFE